MADWIFFPTFTLLSDDPSRRATFVDFVATPTFDFIKASLMAAQSASIHELSNEEYVIMSNKIDFHTGFPFD